MLQRVLYNHLHLKNGKYAFVRSLKTSGRSDAINKKLLTEFKQKTGYSFAKCNEALKKFDNDIEKAEEWLHTQAEKEGWTKSEKLKSRSTSQGLVGVLRKDNFASLVEISCETDFVARNELFQELVATTSQATLDFRKRVILQGQKLNSSSSNEISHLRETLLAHEISSLSIKDSETLLEEYLVSIIGKVGENIKFKRAMALATPVSNIIGTASHGNTSGIMNDCRFGTFSSCVVLKPHNNNIDSNTKENLLKLANGLSHHVIGMNPKVIKDTTGVASEDTLNQQEYLLNDKLTVMELLNQHNCEIIDFIRYGVNQ